MCAPSPVHDTSETLHVAHHFCPKGEDEGPPPPRHVYIYIYIYVYMYSSKPCHELSLIVHICRNEALQLQAVAQHRQINASNLQLDQSIGSCSMGIPERGL